MAKNSKVLKISSFNAIWSKKTDKALAMVSQKNELLNVKRNFVGFRNNHIDSTDIVYHDIHELRSNSPTADVYICGSDQVWNNRL